MRKSITSVLAIWIATAMAIACASLLASAQTYTVVDYFDSIHAYNPGGALAQGRNGNLYGVASAGGSANDGVVFKTTTTGKLSVLYNFEGSVTPDPTGLSLGSDGAFYGTTNYGGIGYGTVFKITTAGAETVLHTFMDCEDGGLPRSWPVQGSDGSFYGTTLGDCHGAESGSIYKFTTTGVYTSFASAGGESVAPLIQGTDGYFYGTTLNGGPYGLGTIFRATSSGSANTVYSFGDEETFSPLAPVLEASDGNLYGITLNGGTWDNGGIFKLTGFGRYTLLYGFGDTGGSEVGLIQATDGNLYSVGGGGVHGCGVLFQMTLGGTYSVMHTFDCTNGGTPSSILTQHTDGKLYGVTQVGGTGDAGVIYCLDLGLPPFVRLVLPRGYVGETGGILGQGLSGTTGVSINGTPAAFKVYSDTYMTTTVPPGATTGYVTVTTPSGTWKSNVPFQVLP